MDETKQPGIRFENIFLHKMSFSRSPEAIERPELSVALSSRAAIDETEKRLVLEVDAAIEDNKSKSFQISCTMIGFFSVVEGEANLAIKEFAKFNAVALVLPYIRELIANTTLRAGLKPVILPPLNVKSVVAQPVPSN